jgi:ABC-2 type transport system permease protein
MNAVDEPRKDVTAIILKELRNHLASFRFWVGALLTVVLAAASAWISARDYSLRLHNYRERMASQQRELQSLSVYSYLQPLVVRPPEALSVLDTGAETRLGTDVAIHLFAVPVEATGKHGGNEFLVSFPPLGLTTIVSLVLGLLALLLTYDAVVGEREDGMLRAVFANRVTRQAVLAGKLAGGLLALSLPLGAALLVSLSLFGWETKVALSSDQWLRVAGLGLAYLAYLSLMLLVGLLISLSVGSSSRALGLAVLVWFVFTIVVPDVAWRVASDLVATESAKQSVARESAALTVQRDQLLAQERQRDPLRSAFSGHRAMSYTSGENQAVRYRNGSAPYYDSLAAYYRLEAEIGRRYAVRLFAAQEQYEERLRTGERLGATLAALSPAFLLDRLSESFAGTSVAEHDRFLKACRRYRLSLLEYLERKGAFHSWRWFTDDPPERLLPWPHYLGLQPEEVDPARARPLFSRLSEPRIAAQVRQDQEAIERDPSRRLHLEDMPRFTYRGPSFLVALRLGAAEAGALLILNVLAVVVAWARFRRYDLG